ncbi:MAG: FKBP-type peptidyl-prolyl cis-trans isomerase [Gammaproteobacteria bacterium]|nr:FKBP-type peptidyl-prolyl cis-trans isomerase [Gammaproteobacteria bacterium]
MNKNTLLSVLALSLSLLAPLSLAQDDAVEQDSDERYGYAVGVMIGTQLFRSVAEEPGLDHELVLQGISDVMRGEELRLTETEALELVRERQSEKQAEATAQSEEKIAMGEAYREENRGREGVVETASGLQYEILHSGPADEAGPVETDTVVVHYQGTLIDGTVFDSSYARGEPAVFSLVSIIPGWTEVLQLMKPGDKWRVVIPPELGYGERGAGPTIGPFETLLFEIELLEVKRSSQ